MQILNNFNSKTFVRWLIIGGVLAFSLIADRLAQTFPLFLWVGGTGALVLGLLALKNMAAALTLVLLTSATTGFSFASGRTDPIPGGLLMIAGLVVVWFFKMMILDRKFYLRPSPVNLPVITFLTACLVSWVVGYGIWDWMVQVNKNIFVVQVGQFAIYALSLAAMLLAYQQNLKEKDLMLWTWIVIAIGVGGMIFEILTGSVFARNRLGITGTLYVLPVVLATAQLIFNPNLKIAQKAVCILVLLIWGDWVLNNLVWKGGWLPALLGLVLLTFFRSWKLFLFGLLLFAILSLANLEFLTSNLIAPEVASTSTIRPIIWMDVIRMVLPRSPLLGLGLVNYMYYWYDPTFVSEARVAAGSAFINNYVFVIPSHNMFVDIFAQAGLLGLGLFLWLVTVIMRVLYVNTQRLKPGFQRAFTIGMTAGFAAMLVSSFWFADWLLPFVYNINITGFRQSVYAWILLGGALTISSNQIETDKRAGS